LVFRSALLLILLLPALAASAPLDAEIERLTSSGAAARAHWGVYAKDLDAGRVLADVNGLRLFVPASTRKLVTTSMAARQLGPNKTFQTAIYRVGDDLVVKAVGDPTWTAELGGRPGRSRLNALARQVADAGIASIPGDLVIDASRYYEPTLMPPAWNWEDFQASYGAIPSVFGMDHNLGRVEIAPARPGEPLAVSLPSAAAPFEIENRARTGSNGSAPTLQLYRGLDGLELEIWGSLPADAQAGARSIPLGDPVGFAARELLDALSDAGVRVAGGARVAKSAIEASGEPVAIIVSEPMSEVLRETNHESDNFLAESLYVLCGAEMFGRGSYESGHSAEERLWKGLDVDDDEVIPQDGCGLSRKNLITPHAMVMLLESMRAESALVDSLAVSGRSGTIRYRLSENGMAGRVRAKTGTLEGVSALAGYVTTNSGRTVAFAVFANGYASSSSPIRSKIDEIVEMCAR